MIDSVKKYIGFSAICMGLMASAPAQAGYIYSIDATSGLSEQVLPIVTAESISSFYNYFSSKAHVDFSLADDAVYFFLHEDSTNGDIGLGMVFGTSSDGARNTLNIDFSGLPAASSVVVSDDAGELTKSTPTTAAGRWGWVLGYTDGGAFAGLESAIWDIDAYIAGFAGVTSWYFMSGSGNSANPDSIMLALDAGDELSVHAAEAVPSPSALALLGLGLFGLGLSRRNC